ncbi:hypothetical protein C7413_12026 [Paraburkholderia silvatlantica]|nr:hypothetical protein C7411_12126 [Paraburkholderia silvatlantica]PXW33253.1 hypothetical protein C7413_12026 [Paraburkholderia silvatlantica]
MAVDAVVRNIAIMGKAARNITRDDPDFAAAHPDIPWEAMYGMRNHSDAQVLCRGRRHCLEHREVIFART